MKLKIFISLLTIMLSSIALGNMLQRPVEFNAAPSNVYAPQGFDTNDNVEFIFEGQFTDACYKVGLTHHMIDHEEKKIYITDTGHHFDDALCAEVLVPYQKQIHAGMLLQGNYEVLFKNSRGNFVNAGVIPVKAATSDSPDDYLYAPVKQSKFYRKSKSNTKPYLLLMGQYHNSCMKIDDVKVNQRADSNVVDILPIVKMIGDDCQDIQEGLDFEHKVDLSHLNEGRFLLHTRSLNGQSVNEIAEIR